MRRVLTLVGDEFEKACGKLSQMVVSDGFTPDVIIGIKSGGDVIGKAIAAYFPGACYASVSASRPGSSAKRRNVSLLSKLPYFITNPMRIVESYLLSICEHGDSERDVVMELSEKCHNLLNKSGCKVLIIDDAIDSGATLRQVKGKLLGMFPECCCKSAVITVTTSSPVEIPEFRLFSNKLIRFPWSTDLRR